MKANTVATTSRRSQRLLIALLALGAVAVVMKPARADEDAERERLARISYELQQLRQMIGTANTTSDRNTRVRFRYDWLERDVELIQRGIDDHLDAPRQPRAVQPLRGDYRN